MSRKSLEAPDSHHLNSAIGWLELGNADEAQLNLHRISKHFWSHPDVLVVRWKILARKKNWDRSLEIAENLVEVAPDLPRGWICLSYSLSNTDRNADALQQLRSAARRFPEVSAIPYFLARLSSQIGNKEEATRWLTKWYSMVDEAELKKVAMNDPRLRSIWKELGDKLPVTDLTAPPQKEEEERQTLVTKTGSYSLFAGYLASSGF